MSSYFSAGQGDAWQIALQQLQRMSSMLANANEQPMHLNHFAKAYGAFAKAYLEAIQAEGKSSMRAAAAAKALDLHTPKSQLEEFLAKKI